MLANQASHHIYTTNTLSAETAQQVVPQQSSKWQYLLSDSIKFAKPMTSGIRIQKPNQELVFTWVMKIITSGQCDSVYIENHKFADVQVAVMQQAAKLYQVNVTVLDVVKETNNVIVGPW